MHQLAYYNLILRYPGLRQYINQCYVNRQIPQLFDFLMGISTGESSLRDA